MIAARPAGDAALLVEAGELAGPLAAAVRSWRLPGVTDVIAGARTVLIITEPGRWDLGELERRVTAAAPAPGEPWAGGQAAAEIPVVYDGPDLAEVAQLTGLTPDEVIARHAGAQYTVGWLGFSPGFAYLTGLDPALQVPRLAAPRTAVPAGSVAIAGGLAAVYPTASPGGWRLLGRTSVRLWDSHRVPPALLGPGMAVRFRPVAELPSEADMPATDAPAGHDPAAFHDPLPFSVNATEKGNGSWMGPRIEMGGPWIEVIRPGPLATVQDLGRPGFGHLGVPSGGAADAGSLTWANELVGNPEGAAGLEFTLGRAVLRFGRDAVVAATGAAAAVTMDAGAGGEPGGDGSPGAGGEPGGGGHAGAVGFGVAVRVPAGAVLRIGAPAAGLRTYLAVRGGIDAELELGSRSADLLSGLGPKPLRAGDLLGTGGPGGSVAGVGEAGVGEAGPGLGRGEAGAGPGVGVAGRGPGGGDAGGASAMGSGAGRAVPLTVVPGPRDDWFTAAALEVLCGTDYTVRPASDRTGLRLDGPVLPRAIEGELDPEGMVTGALQVPPDGRPILLLAGHPVTGGYPVIAVVVSADIGKAAQLRPGQAVRFRRGG
ncbi:MAG: 5-oxoprolinase/urea amidolyase family protein [Actinomycetota bacterium]